MPNENLPPLTPDQQNRELLEKIYASTEKTRKLFLWTLVISIVAFVLPLIGLALAIPVFLNTYASALFTELGI